jgi:hypothetical protein
MPDLRTELERIRIPDAEEHERQARLLIEAAFDERSGGSGERRRHPGWIAAAVLSLIGATVIALTPAGAEVRQWIKDTVADVGEPNAKPALTRLPAPGSLLVSAGRSTWIVSEAGERSRLGRFDDVGWSPHGLYVATGEGRSLSARTAAGEVRWEIGADAAVSDPVWSPNEGFRVAYRSGDQLRVVWGDGVNDSAIGPSAAVTPAWKPRTGKRNVLAYADPVGRVRIVDADTGELLGESASPVMPIGLEWNRDGSQLLVLHRNSIRILDPEGNEIRGTKLSRRREAVSGSFLPGLDTIVLLLRSERSGGRSSIVLADHVGDEFSKRAIFTGSGRLTGLAVAPNGRRILVGWPRADQWLFIPTMRTNRIEAVGNIRRQFSAGRNGPFPRVDGWCCQARR